MSRQRSACGSGTSAREADLSVASVHNMQPDIPPQNIVAMADAVRRFGTYPLS